MDLPPRLILLNREQGQMIYRIRSLGYSREHEIKRSIIRIYNCRGFLFSSMKGVGERDGWDPIPIIEFRSPFVRETATLEISDRKSWIGRAKAGNGADIRQVEQLWPK